MNERIMKDLARELSRRRATLIRESGSQDELRGTLEQQESELEEAAQKDRITRLTSCRSQDQVSSAAANGDVLTAGGS